MSKQLYDFEVDARVYYVDINTKQAKVQGVGVQLKAYNKGNAKKRAERELSKLKDVDRVEVVKAKKITPIDKAIKH